MATAQMHRNTVSSVSLPTRVATEQQSLVLIKRLLAVSISCITYLRGLFPENAYGTRYLEDICVKILREDKSCPGSTQLVKWMLGCYDALQKKYLRMVVLAIYTNPEDPQTITECYQFRFKYTSTGPIMDFTSSKGSSSISACSDVKKASILLIRKLYVLMQNLGPLPNDVCLTMKLFYYDEVTPEHYQPPGFKEGSCEGMMFEGEPMYLNVGEVATPFHVLKVKVTTEKDRMEDVEKNLLKDRETKSPQSIRLDTEEGEKPDQTMTDESAAANKVEQERNDIDSMNVEDLSLTCPESENMKSDGYENSQAYQTLQGNSSPVVTGRKTRSGKVFVNSRCSPQPVLTNLIITQLYQTYNRRDFQARQEERQCNQPYEIPRSQDEPSAPKKRKFSEPKDLY
ncbi:HORMA domain-containing protein 1 [Pelodytes ibericus]